MNRGKIRWKLSIVFSILLFLSIAFTAILSGTLTMVLVFTGVLRGPNPLVAVIPMGISILVGTALARLATRHPLSALSAMSQAAKEVAGGNFTVALDENSPIDELRNLAHNFNSMTRELAGTELLRTDFVENVSHEFKTPLSAIEGYAVLLQRRGLSKEKQAEYIGKILHNTRRLSTLTSDILLLSRLEHQGLDIPRETFCLDEQLREVILSQEQGWTEKRLELEIELDGADCRGNRDLLAHVWQNLLSNAVKFTPEGGQVRVLLRRELGRLIVSVADSGSGMENDVQQRVFEKFYQGDVSRSSQGNGLGLALVKRIIDLHCGEIVVDSTLGMGSKFTVCLPALLCQPERK